MSGESMLHIGDEVVVMSAAGRFRVVAVEGEVVTIEQATGDRRTLLERSVRLVQRAQS